MEGSPQYAKINKALIDPLIPEADSLLRDISTRNHQLHESVDLVIPESTYEASFQVLCSYIFENSTDLCRLVEGMMGSDGGILPSSLPQVESLNKFLRKMDRKKNRFVRVSSAVGISSSLHSPTSWEESFSEQTGRSLDGIDA
eukprot:TRINITY_DN8742_c0_g1_i2.p1 TRINITY_DN8742_c0_g1~~TRINITY_DN8742_c0_g1_i2.p1  ORF type:complete len:143 (-),score=25.33 TRINITY_DN8742_c0_g1_i2:99-527(-)